MDKLFFSKDNFNLLSQIISQNVKEQYDYDIKNNFNKAIVNGMRFVYENINPNPPKDMSKEKYLDMMNLKSLSVVIPKIEEKISGMNTTKHIPQKQISQPTLQEQFPNAPQTFSKAGYAPDMKPMPVIQEKDVNLDKRFEEMQNDRFPTQPYPQPSNNEPTPHNFTDKDNSIKPDEMDKLVQEKISARQDIEQFFPSKENINFNPQPMSDMDMENSFAPAPPHQMSQAQQEQFKTIENYDHHNRTKIQQYQTHEVVQKQMQEDSEKVRKELEMQHEVDRKRIIEKEKNIKAQVEKHQGEILSDKSDIINIPNNVSENISNGAYKGTDTFNPNNVNNFISPVIYPPKPQFVKRTHYIHIDSKDRDLEVYPNPSHFQVKFSPATDEKIFTPVKVNINGTEVLYVFKENVEGERGASVTKNYENIYSISCIQAILPRESIYVCGSCPNNYYNNSVDTICDPSMDVFPVQSNSFRAIWNNKIGIQTTVLDEPYLYLNIKELEEYSPYSGTDTSSRNAFAKLVYEANFGFLSAFIKMQTADIDEYFVHAPTALSQIDKFTLTLQNPQGKTFNFGKDKMFIESFTQGTNLKRCEQDIVSTRITICKEFTFCENGKEECDCTEPIRSHCLKPGDLIFLYSVRPCNPVFVQFQDPETYTNYTNFTLIINEDGTLPSNNKNLSINILLGDMEETEEPVNFNTFLCVGDYLVLKIDKCDYFFRVLSLDCTNVTVDVPTDVTLMDGPIDKIGFAKKDNKGIQTDFKTDLNYKFGVRVCNVGNSDIDCNNYDPDDFGSTLFFDIEFPYEQIPQEFLDSFCSGEMFFIKQKLQVNYTFKVITLEKDYNPLESRLVK